MIQEDIEKIDKSLDEILDFAMDVAIKLTNVIRKVTDEKFNIKLLSGKRNHTLQIELIPYSFKKDRNKPEYCISLEKFLSTEFFENTKHFGIQTVFENGLWISQEESEKIKQILKGGK